MGQKISALLALQSIERKLAHVRNRLRAKTGQVNTQRRKVEQLQADKQEKLDQAKEKRVSAELRENELRQREEQVAKQRTVLNSAKTNKEYAAVLTQINTLRADNSKIEEEVLAMMQEVEGIEAEAAGFQEQIDTEQKRLDAVSESAQGEIDKLQTMIDDLSAQRAEAEKDVEPDLLTAFNRLAETYDGEAMAIIEAHGGSKKSPDQFVCGGCYMTLTPEHVNALSTRDDIRTCDSCGRILYLQEQAGASR